MAIEVWDLAEVKTNARGVLERDIWSLELVRLKEKLKRKVDLVMFSESWRGRWDLFAYELYRDQYLWWVVPVVNDLRNLFVEPEEGTILRVPHVNDVIEFLRWR